MTRVRSRSPLRHSFLRLDHTERTSYRSAVNPAVVRSPVEWRQRVPARTRPGRRGCGRPASPARARPAHGQRWWMTVEGGTGPAGSLRGPPHRREPPIHNVGGHGRDQGGSLIAGISLDDCVDHNVCSRGCTALSWRRWTGLVGPSRLVLRNIRWQPLPLTTVRHSTASSTHRP